MEPNEWKQAASETSEDIKRIKKLIRYYEYSSRENSIITDEKICDFFVRKIREAKDMLFGMIETMYELQEEKMINKKLEELKDTLDIFSDEIKVRHCEWKDIDLEWIKKLVKHDEYLLSGLVDLNSFLENFSRDILKSEEIRSDGTVVYDKLFWEDMEGRAKKAEEQIERLVIAFRERDAICNIKPISLERTFQKIRKEIE